MWRGPDEDRRAAELQVARTRIAVLEDRIRIHRLMVRDGWVSPHRPDRKPNEWLWSAVEETDG